MGEATDERLRRQQLAEDEPHTEERTLPANLPQPPSGLSRVDTLPEGFSTLLSRRPLFIGDVVANRFKLVESLGDGGMGQVFVGENLAIGRRVAIKVLKPELLADAHFRKRFQHEAHAIAAIEHRNVARFLDLVVGDPTFLVMEYVAGPTLAAVLKNEGRLDIRRAVRIAKSICWGLDAVHAAGVVHRDLKPANIILAPDAERGEEPKIIDFGLAKLAFGPAEQLTRVGQIVGTPHYMSPEQVENREVDQRADVYALGCLFYHMLAGRPPFQGADDLAVLYQQVRSDPEDLKRLVPNAPSELSAILKRAMQKDPDRRYPSTKEMAAALARFERGVEAGARSPRVGGLRWALLASLLLLALAVGGLIARPARGGAMLVIGSDPLGAVVELDGARLPETTPTAVRGLRAGPHRLRVFADGFAAHEQVVHVDRGGRMIVHDALSPSTRSLTVETVPAGALVYIDGRLQIGQTPLSFEISEGDFHGLRLEKAGFVPVQHAIKPEDRASSITIALKVEEQPRGMVWIDSNQASHVFIDGADTGLVAPTVGLIVPAGPHAFELRDSGGLVIASTKVTVAQGDSLHLTMDGCTPSHEGGK